MPFINNDSIPSLEAMESYRPEFIKVSSDALVVDDGFTPTFGSANQTGIADTGEHFTSTSVEGALQEVGETLTSVDAQLAEKTLQLEENRIKYYPAQTVMTKTYMTIIDDDARTEVLTKLKPLAIEKGIPITLAVPVIYETGIPLTESELLDLQNNLGWEMASHLYTHPNLRIMTNEQIRHEIIDSKDTLESWGLNVENVVYPFGSAEGGANSAYIKELSSKYYNCGASVGGSVYNEKPVKSFNLSRYPLGSYFEVRGEVTQNTLALYKERLDEAIANNGWIIFMTHCSESTHDATQTQILSDLIDYAITNDVSIVNLRDGYEQMGNCLEIEGKFGVDKDGTVWEVGVFKDVLNESLTGDTAIDLMKKGTITRRSFNISEQGTLPQAGVLEVFRPFVEDDYGYEKLFAYNGTIFYRRWLVNGWQPWVQISTKKFYTISVDCGTVNASSIKYFNIGAELPTIGVRDTVIIQPDINAEIPAEIILSNNCTMLQLFNTYSSAMLVGTKTFNVTILIQP